MPKKPAKPPSLFDPASDVIVLRLVGGRRPAGVPERDLHAGDLARVAYERALAALERDRSRLVPVGGTEPPPGRRPDAVTAEQVEVIARELVESGTFTWADQPVPEPAPPAAEPEA